MMTLISGVTPGIFWEGGTWDLGRTSEMYKYQLKNNLVTPIGFNKFWGCARAANVLIVARLQDLLAFHGFDWPRAILTIGGPSIHYGRPPHFYRLHFGGCAVGVLRRCVLLVDAERTLATRVPLEAAERWAGRRRRTVAVLFKRAIPGGHGSTAFACTSTHSPISAARGDRYVQHPLQCIRGARRARASGHAAERPKLGLALWTGQATATSRTPARGAPLPSEHYLHCAPLGAHRSLASAARARRLQYVPACHWFAARSASLPPHTDIGDHLISWAHEADSTAFIPPVQYIRTIQSRTCFRISSCVWGNRKSLSNYRI